MRLTTMLLIFCLFPACGRSDASIGDSERIPDLADAPILADMVGQWIDMVSAALDMASPIDLENDGSYNPCSSNIDRVCAMTTNSENLIISDHFTGSVADQSKWEIIGTSAPTIADDSSSGGNGALAMGGVDKQIIRTKPLALGVGDFTVSARLRISDMVPTYIFHMGIHNGNTGILLITHQGSGWSVAVDGMIVNPTSPPISSAYSEYKISRKSNILTFSVNGVVFHTMPYIKSLTGASLCFESNSKNGGATRVDYVLLSISP